MINQTEKDKVIIRLKCYNKYIYILPSYFLITLNTPGQNVEPNRKQPVLDLKPL